MPKSPQLHFHYSKDPVSHYLGREMEASLLPVDAFGPCLVLTRSQCVLSWEIRSPLSVGAGDIVTQINLSRCL